MAAVWGELLLEIPAIPKPQSILPVDAVKANLALSEDVPVVLPCRGPFDLIYAFSVFTHLSEKTTNAVLNILSSFRLYRLFLFISFAAATFFVDNPVLKYGVRSQLARVGVSFHANVSIFWMKFLRVKGTSALWGDLAKHWIGYIFFENTLCT